MSSVFKIPVWLGVLFPPCYHSFNWELSTQSSLPLDDSFPLDRKPLNTNCSFKSLYDGLTRWSRCCSDADRVISLLVTDFFLISLYINYTPKLCNKNVLTKHLGKLVETLRKIKNALHGSAVKNDVLPSAQIVVKSRTEKSPEFWKSTRR